MGMDSRRWASSNMQTLPISIPTEAVADFCRRHGITSLALFGSVLREDFGPESDVDFLVEFAPDRIPGLIRLAGIELELSALIGRKADMNTAGCLSKYFVDEVLREAVPIYAAA
jgi:predicted nucleotidyltransferase